MDLEDFEPQLVADYAWSAWSALGAPGWGSDRFQACVDVEALILVTGALGDSDPRLRDEALRWCATNATLVSRSRLGALWKQDPADPSWGVFACSLESATDLRWAGAEAVAEPVAIERGGEPHSGRPAALALRLRGLMGATARSEVVRALLLLDSGQGLTSRDLAVETGFTPSALSDALDGLRLARVVRTDASTNLQHHVLAQRAAMAALVAPLPDLRRSQRYLLRLARRLLRARATLSGASARVREVELAKLLSEVLSDVLSSPDRVSLPESARTSLEGAVAWCADELRRALGE